MAGVVDQAALVYDVASGAEKARLTSLKNEVQAQRKEIINLQSNIQKMQDGAAKDQAQETLSAASAKNAAAVKQLNEAISAHNEISSAIAKYTLGTYNPGTVSRLGYVQVVIGGAVLAAIIASVGFAIYAYAEATRAAKAEKGESDGLITQTRKAIEATGQTVSSVGNTAVKTALAVAAVVGVYVGYQLFRDWRGARRQSAPALPVSGDVKVSTLKPVAGAVVR